MNFNADISILLVEDDENLGFVTQEGLEDKGYHVVWAKDGVEGYELFHASKFNICLIDVMMPKKDGFTLAKEIKTINEEVPIFFLTARSQEEDKIEGLTIGVDDYITKPFSIDELDLRIKNLLNRINKVQNETHQKDVYTLGQYTFNYPDQILSFQNNERKLTKKEAALLRLLCIHKGEVLQRNSILRIIWGSDDYFLGRSMDVFITKLRKYLTEDPQINISNVHGVGFKLEVNE
ncbi:response regulator transcription factor [bacterium SCSIO 12643]|nr:response regulator transcription factor [bacterium SCSIO 12643]